jgi:hypothetical protein
MQWKTAKFGDVVELQNGYKLIFRDRWNRKPEETNILLPPDTPEDMISIAQSSARRSRTSRRAKNSRHRRRRSN